MQNNIHIICGATCSGKTGFAVEFAKQIVNNPQKNCVIINCDSMQIYKELPILTAQPKTSEQQEIPHLLYGDTSILEHSNVTKWLEKSVPLIKEILQNNQTPILVGGTGMYIKSLKDGINSVPDITDDIKSYTRNFIAIEGLEAAYKLLQQKAPEHAEKLKAGDSQRIERALNVVLQTGKSLLWWNSQPAKKFFNNDIDKIKVDFKIQFLNPPREVIYNKINQRFLNMIDEGVLDEVRKVKPLHDSGELSELNPSFKAHGLRELLAYLRGEISIDIAIDKAQQITRNYAKRQTTWFTHQL